jgi:hypothetical protein
MSGRILRAALLTAMATAGPAALPPPVVRIA